MKTKMMKTFHQLSPEVRRRLLSNDSTQTKVLDQRSIFHPQKESLIFKISMEMKVPTTLI